MLLGYATWQYSQTNIIRVKMQVDQYEIPIGHQASTVWVRRNKGPLSQRSVIPKMLYNTWFTTSGYGVMSVVVLNCPCQKTWAYSRWSNFVAISSRSRDISISGLEAAILDFRLPVTLWNVGTTTIEKLDVENDGVGFGILLIRGLESETVVDLPGGWGFDPYCNFQPPLNATWMQWGVGASKRLRRLDAPIPTAFLTNRPHPGGIFTP